MKNKNLYLLGKTVLPIVKIRQYEASNWDKNGNLPFLRGDERLRYANNVVNEAVREQRQINKEQVWEVFSIHADGTFTLKSDYGYEQANVSRSDFRLIKSV